MRIKVKRLKNVPVFEEKCVFIEVNRVQCDFWKVAKKHSSLSVKRVGSKWCVFGLSNELKRASFVISKMYQYSVDRAQ